MSPEEELKLEQGSEIERKQTWREFRRFAIFLAIVLVVLLLIVEAIHYYRIFQ